MLPFWLTLTFCVLPCLAWLNVCFCLFVCLSVLMYIRMCMCLWPADTKFQHRPSSHANSRARFHSIFGDILIHYITIQCVFVQPLMCLFVSYRYEIALWGSDRQHMFGEDHKRGETLGDLQPWSPKPRQGDYLHTEKRSQSCWPPLT